MNLTRVFHAILTLKNWIQPRCMEGRKMNKNKKEPNKPKKEKKRLLKKYLDSVLLISEELCSVAAGEALKKILDLLERDVGGKWGKCRGKNHSNSSYKNAASSA
ncbi:hypothetical protein CEXT_97091 [Caerostris extrusa]|uniref:Uncharacterized protein n=1 Tax=Caerostris extrusa TaxID=172846 RepID=A0AAV4RBG4_CAEEX|nr:hypothetical protein CEXT_97091 [Caerostris extrusa]